MIRPESDGFAGILEAVMEEEYSSHPLADALLVAQEQVWKTTNMGRTRDETDLYHVIDQLSSGVVAAHPSSLCYSGCGRCCHYPTAFFDIFPQEWALIKEHIEAEWEPERRARWLERFQHEHGPYLYRIRFLEWIMGFTTAILPTHQALPLPCPFMESDRCAIYPVRPLACRTFGHFAAKTTPWSAPHPYACYDQSVELRDSMAKEPLQVMLPDVSTVMLRQYAFVSGKKRVMATWIALTYFPSVMFSRWRRLHDWLWECGKKMR